MKRDVLLIGLASLAARVAFVMVLGVRNAPDTAWYIAEAVRWRESGAGPLSLLSLGEARSPLFVALLAGLQSFIDNWRLALVGIQTLLSAAVPVALYLAARGGGVGRRGAWTSAMLAIASFELSRWNAYVLTDALFIVFSGTAMCAAIAALSTRRIVWAVTTGALVIGALLTRPAGPAVAFAVVLAACLVRPPALRVVAGAGVVIAAVVALESYLSRSETGRPLAIHACTQLIQGRVIFGQFDSAPLTDVDVPGETSTARCLMQVVREHPRHVANVIARRAIVYWLPVYPNYSTRHNLANLFLLGVPLILAGVGLVVGRRGFRDDVVRVVGASFVVGFGLFHTATWSEGDHRFLAPVLLAIYLLAGLVVDRFLSDLPVARDLGR